MLAAVGIARVGRARWLHERAHGLDALGLLAALWRAVYRLDGVLAVELIHHEDALESVQQSRFGSRFVLRHFNLQIVDQTRRTLIPYLKFILYTPKLKFEMQMR